MYMGWSMNSWVPRLSASIAATRDFKSLARAGFVVSFGSHGVSQMTIASPEVSLQDCLASPCDQWGPT
jgi:hypothetical protein